VIKQSIKLLLVSIYSAFAYLLLVPDLEMQSAVASVLESDFGGCILYSNSNPVIYLPVYKFFWCFATVISLILSTKIVANSKILQVKRFFILPSVWITFIFYLMLEEQAQLAFRWIGFTFGYYQPENVVSVLLNVILILSFTIIWRMPRAQIDLFGVATNDPNLKDKTS
jgi:hypothetical protein